MKFDSARLSQIYDRTSGQCHICRKKLAFKNYGALGRRGAWEVEHSNPQANGGTHRLINLFAACISCNRSKGASSTRSARAKHGWVTAPLSFEARKRSKAGNALLGAGGAALVGGALAGPPGVLVGAAIGALIGFETETDRR